MEPVGSAGGQSTVALISWPNFVFFDPPPIKIMGGVGDMSESIFHARPRTQPLTERCWAV